MTPEKNRNQSNLWHRKLRVVKKGPPRQVLPATLKLIGTAISLNFQRTCTSFFVGDHWQGQGRSLRPATISGSPPAPRPRPSHARFAGPISLQTNLIGNWIEPTRRRPEEAGGTRRRPKTDVPGSCPAACPAGTRHSSAVQRCGVRRGGAVTPVALVKAMSRLRLNYSTPRHRVWWS